MYDPTFAFEVAVIIQDGLRRMYVDQESVFYYITTMNENYRHPPMPEGAEAGILKGLYRLRPNGAKGDGPRVQLMGSGTILNEVIAAAEILESDFGVSADLWSAPSFNELAREGRDAVRWNLLHPEAPARASYVEQCLGGSEGPVIAATDYIGAYAEQIRAFVPGRYVVLGTDGFGRSDLRKSLRRHFEVDRHYVTVAALKALADEGVLPASRVTEAIQKFDIDPQKPNPLKA